MTQPKRPNILFIMPDQLRADFLGAYDAAFIDTPHIDSLCEHGVLYSNCCSPHPLCVPARVSLMVGMDALRTGVTRNGLFLRSDYGTCGVRTWPEILVENGYATAAIGKMHFTPFDARLGFEVRVIAEDKMAVNLRDDYADYLAEHGLRRLRGQEHEGYFETKGAIVSPIPWEHSVDHYVGRETCRYITEYDDERPFALMVGFPGPHPPFDPCPEFVSRFSPDDMPDPIPPSDCGAPEMRRRNLDANAYWHEHDYSDWTVAQKKRLRAHYAALVSQIDHEVGCILKALRAKGELENTVILFSADHGELMGDHGMIGKHAFFEGACRVPMLAWLPWAEGQTTRDDLVTLTDVTATILGLAGAPVPEGMDSRPLPGLGLAGDAPRERVFGALTDIWMVQDRRHRLIKCATGEAMLYDDHRDPHQQHNLIGDPAHAVLRERLDGELTAHVMDTMSQAIFPRLNER